jgi:hypothetical protein
MKHRLELGILPQPDGTTCGPTCLHAVYRYHGDDVPLQQTIDETHRLDEGGTYAVFLAQHALRRGYRATIYTYNLRVFDPTWFSLSREAMLARLELRRKVFAHKPKLETVMRGYAEFLSLGGDVLLEDLTPGLIRKYLNRGVPILTGLSSTYLYRAMREHGANMDDDDVRGDPQGHFVVLCGYDKEDRTVLVADPMSPNPAFQGLTYVVNIERVLCSILLGVMTQDAELLILEPPERLEGAGEGSRGGDRPAGGPAGKEARSPWPS